MKLILLTGLVLIELLPSNARAVEGFFNQSTLPARPKNISRVRNSTAKLRQASQGDTCSLTITSSDGYALLALHCLKVCLITEACGLSVDSLGLKNPKVIFGGSGHLSSSDFEDSKIMSYDKSWIKYLKSHFGDYVIVKFETKTPLQCSPISKSPPAVNQPIWSRNFPGGCKNRDKIKTQGKTQGTFCFECKSHIPEVYQPSEFEKLLGRIDEQEPIELESIDPRKGFGRDRFSYGHVRKDLSKNAYYLESKFSKEQIQRLNEFYLADGRFVSDLDACGGSSGAGIFNSDGKMVGLITDQAVGSETSEDVYYKDSTIGITTSSIYKAVKQKIGLKKADQIFNCPSTK